MRSKRARHFLIAFEFTSDPQTSDAEVVLHRQGDKPSNWTLTTMLSRHDREHLLAIVGVDVIERDYGLVEEKTRYASVWRQRVKLRLPADGLLTAPARANDSVKAIVALLNVS